MKKILIYNFFSLTAIQAVNYILPLITIPYLVRILGPHKFGAIAFAQAFIQYFVLITDYGFNLSATRKISINRDNKNEINKIVSNIFIIKGFLLLVSFLLLCGICLVIPRFKNEMILYIITFGFVFGNAFIPVWFFQGIEKMKVIALLNIVGKFVFTISIFVLIKKQSDYLCVAALNSLAQVIVAFLALYMLFKFYGIKFVLPTKTDVLVELKDGWHIFISTAAISIYTTGNTFILGLLTNEEIVGYYSAGEKIIRAVVGLIWPFSQTVYPHISKLVSESKDIAISFIKKVIKLVGSLTLLASIVLFLFAPIISNIILGKQFKESTYVIQILSFLPFIIGLSNIFGIQVMLNFGLERIFSKVILMASVLNIVLALILVNILNHLGAAMAWLITEIFVTLAFFFYIQFYGIMATEHDYKRSNH